MHSDGSTVGNPSNRSLAQYASQSSIFEENGTSRLDPHSTERIAAVIATGHIHACPRNGRKSNLGWRKDYPDYVQFHARILFTYSLQVDTQVRTLAVKVNILN